MNNTIVAHTPQIPKIVSKNALIVSQGPRCLSLDCLRCVVGNLLVVSVTVHDEPIRNMVTVVVRVDPHYLSVLSVVTLLQAGHWTVVHLSFPSVVGIILFIGIEINTLRVDVVQYVMNVCAGLPL